MRAHNLRRNFSLRSSLSFFCTFGIHSVCQIEIMDQFSLSTAWNDCEIFFEAQGCSEWSSIVFRPSEGRQNYAGVLSLHISHLFPLGSHYGSASLGLNFFHFHSLTLSPSLSLLLWSDILSRFVPIIGLLLHWHSLHSKRFGQVPVWMAGFRIGKSSPIALLMNQRVSYFLCIVFELLPEPALHWNGILSFAWRIYID